MEQQADNTQELSRLEELLLRPDFVLEPKCRDVLCQYIAAGGQPESIVYNLTDGYMGYAHMASLMCGWMEALDNDLEGTVPSSSTQHTAASQQQPGQLVAGTRQRDYSEFAFLKEFVLSRFDPDKFADVFKAKPPAWLNKLTSNPQGRALIYQLSAAHRNSLFLNWAIQKILGQGHEDEVASVGSSLASYFTVFHRLLATRLRAALAACMPRGTPLPWLARGAGGEQAEDSKAAGLEGGLGAPLGAAAGGTGQASKSREAYPAPALGGLEPSQASVVQSLQQLSRELVDSCAHAGHTYLHAQQLLGAAAEHPRGGALFARMSQDLQAATTAQYPAAWGTMRMLLPPGLPPALVDAASLASKLLAGAPAFPGQDVIRLAALYRTPQPPTNTHQNTHHRSQSNQRSQQRPQEGGKEEDGSNGRLSLLPIRHPALMRLLIAGIFTPGKAVSPDVLDAAIYLLALGTAGGALPPPFGAFDEDRAWQQPGLEQGQGHEEDCTASGGPGTHKRARQGGEEEGVQCRPSKQGRDDREQGLQGLHSIDELFDDEGEGEEDGDVQGGGSAGLSQGGAQQPRCRREGGSLQRRCRSEGERLEDTQCALRCVLAVGAQAGARGIGEGDIGNVQKLVSVPVAAAALLHHMHCHMGSREYYGEAGAPAIEDYLRLALLVARSQPQLVQEVVDLLQCALQSMGSQRAEVAHACLGALVHVMQDCHAVEQVMAAVNTWAKEADPSLVRRLAIQVIVSLAPPYSPAFAHWLLRHIVRSGLRRGRDMHQGTRNAFLLQEFASSCLALVEDPRTSAMLRLEPKELQVLNELKTTK